MSSRPSWWPVLEQVMMREMIWNVRRALGGQRNAAPAVMLSTVLLVTGMVSVVGLTLLDARRDAWTRATDAASNLARAVEHDLASDIRLIDLALEAGSGMLSRAAQAEGGVPFDPDALRAHIASAENLDAVLLIDDKGTILFNSRQEKTDARPSLADRDYFTAHRDNPDLGLYVGRPYRSRLADGALSIGFSRRLSRADGSFAGVALGVVRAQAWRNLFERIIPGENGSMTLLRADGILLMRNPFREDQIGRDLSGGQAFPQMQRAAAGQFTAAAALDGVERVYTFRRLEQLPAIVSVALSTADIYAAWWRKTLIVGTVTSLLAAALLAMTLALLNGLKRRREAEQVAHESEDTFRLLAENTGDMVVRIDGNGMRRYVSPASRHLVGRMPGDMVGRSITDDVLPDDLPVVREALDALAGGGQSTSFSYRVHHADGRLIWIEATARAILREETGEHDSSVLVARDISDRKRLEHELTTTARTDALTGLANRRSFDETLEREWAEARTSGKPLSLLLVDVDRFKLFNDRYGHPEGDSCLRQVGAAISDAVRQGDLVARYGGEEIAIVLPNTEAPDAADVAERVRAAVQEAGIPHPHNQPAGVVTASVGAATALGTESRASASALLAAADGALYEAKHTGRNRVCGAHSVPPHATPAPMPLREQARLAAVASYERVTPAGDPSLDRLAHMIAIMLDAPIALISLVGRDRVTFAGRTGMDAKGCARDLSFSAHLIASEGTSLVVPDATADHRFAGNPAVDREGGLRFYTGVPLVCPDTNERLGAIGVMDRKLREPLSDTELLLLHQFANLAQTDLRLRVAAHAA